jgi:hypothetical protein
MASKEQILDYLKDLAVRNLITKEELVAAYDSGRKVCSRNVEIGDIFTNILIYVGGLLIFLGIEFYLYPKTLAAINVTFFISNFVVGIVLYIAGLFLNKKEDIGNITSFFYFISSGLILLGGIQFLTYSGIKIIYGPPIISASLVLLYLVPFLVSKKNILLFFTIIFITCLSQDLLRLAIAYFGLDYSLIFYFVAVIGIIYICLARILLGTNAYELTAWFYGLGTSSFLASVIYLCVIKFADNPAIELAFIPIALVVVFMGFYFNSKSMVIISDIYLALYAVKLSLQYLPNDFAIAAIICGVMILLNLTIYNSLKNKFFYN